MAIFEFTHDTLGKATPTTFKDEGITERGDLQRLLREHIEVIAPDTFVITEEFGQWEDSSRRIDLLAIDRDANLVVIELKRTADGGHMELQAIRYAAMISTMTFTQAVTAHAEYLQRRVMEGDASERILTFLGWLEPDEEHFAQDVRIVLASEDFSREITTAVIWLNERSLDIRCVRMKPYRLHEMTLIDIQQVIPLPEAADYQVSVREKTEVARAARAGSRWDEPTFMAALEAKKGAAVRSVAEALLRWSEELFKTDVEWGSGQRSGSFVPVALVGKVRHYLFAVWTYGTFEVYFQWILTKPPFQDESLRDQLRDRLNCIPGVAIPPDALTKRPNIPLETFVPEESLRLLRDAFEWALGIIRNPPDQVPAAPAD